MSNDDLAAILWDRFVAKRRRADETLNPLDETAACVAFRKWVVVYAGEPANVVKPKTNVIQFPGVRS